MSILVVAAANVSEPDPAWGFGLGGGLLVIGLAATWAALDLRGRIYRQWRQQVDLAYVGLAERIADSLRELRTAIDTLLPSGALSDPMTIIADPASVEPHATGAITLIRIRRRLPTRLERLLKACSLMKYTAVAFTLLAFIATCMYFFANGSRHVWIPVSWGCALVGVVAVILTGVYAVLVAMLQSAVERADEAVGAAP